LGADGDHVRFDVLSGELWIGAGADRAALVAVDPRAHTRVGEIALRGHPESFQLEQQGRRAFVNVPSAKTIEVVDREQRQVLARWSVPAADNYPMALDEASHRLVVATRSPPRLIVYDVDSGSVVANLPTVGDVDDLFHDSKAHRVYVSGGDGAVEVYAQDTPDHYVRIDSVATRKGARTSLFVPEWRKLFVALPRLGEEPAEIRVFAVAP
jgi:hypothetical protein